MRLLGVLPVLALCLCPPLWADKKLDEAVAKAKAQLAKGKPDDAVKTLSKAASQSKDASGQLALADLLSRLGRLDEAGTALEAAGQLASSAAPGVKATVLAKRSAFALRAGTVESALDLARQAVAAERGAGSLAALARAQARAGLPDARATAEEAVKADPTSVLAQVARGDALLAAHLARDAEAAYGKAAEREPQSALALTGVALALAAQGKAAPALEAARAAAKADPHSGEALAAVGLAHLAADPGDRKSEAAAAVQQAAFLAPKNALVKLTVGRVFEARGQLDAARAAYDEAAGLDPTWAAPRVAALSIEARQGDAASTLAQLRALPEPMRRSGEAQLLLGRLLSSTGDADGAMAALEAAVAALPGRADAQAAEGDAAYEVGNLALAADALGRAAALDPADPGLEERYGRHLAYDGRLDRAVEVLQDAVRRGGGKDTAGLVALGEAYRSYDPPHVAEAVGAYEEALKIEPRDAAALLGIARTYQAGKQWARAESAYERAAKVVPRLEGQATLGLAWCGYMSGDSDTARFYTGVAARSGLDVRGLRDALQASSRTSRDELDELQRDLASSHAGEQVRAVRGLVKLGGLAVPTLSAALGRKSTSLAAREAIVEGFAQMGPAARAALPQLERLVKAGAPETGAADSPVARLRQEREAALVTAAAAAVEKVRGN